MRRPISNGAFFRDEVLELVDLVVEGVDHVEVPLGHLVDQVVDVHPDVSSWAATRFLRRRGIERLLARRRLRDRHECVHRRDEVDLLVVEAILGGHLDREQQDPEDVVAVRLDPRAWLVVVLVRCLEQRRERRRVHVLGQRISQLGRRGVDQIDPLGHARRLRPSPDV